MEAWKWFNLGPFADFGNGRSNLFAEVSLFGAERDTRNEDAGHVGVIDWISIGKRSSEYV